MKLHFFKTKTTISRLVEKNKNYLEQEIAQQLRSTKSSSHFVKIVYTLVSEHGRRGSKCAAKLAESNEDVIYFLNKHKKYQITGILGNVICNENTIAQMLTEKIEMGKKYNCVLSDWYLSAD